MEDIVVVVTDLFFHSRIAAAARAADRRMRVISSAAALAGIDGYTLALVDLDARLDIPEIIRSLKQHGSGTIVAFGPHLDTEARKAARAAGADRVLAKSKFVTELPGLMHNEAHTDNGGRERLDAAEAELRRYGARMEQLGKWLQDPNTARRLYFAPAPHQEEAEAHGEPIVLDGADYLGFLAVDTLQSKLANLRALYGNESAAE